MNKTLKINNMKHLHFLFLFLIACLLLSCQNVMYEKSLIVNSIHKGTGEYKYKYFIEASPADQILYSNKIYHIGDTIKIGY